MSAENLPWMPPAGRRVIDARSGRAGVVVENCDERAESYVEFDSGPVEAVSAFDLRLER